MNKFLGYTLNVLIITAALLAWAEYRRDTQWKRDPQTSKPYEW